MIAVDSTVWIDLVLAEVLQGFPDERQAEAGRLTLERFVIEPMIGRDTAIAAARNHRTLRGRGFTIRRTIDLLIGAFCIERAHVLLHNDRDFDPMARHLGLQVV